MSGSVGNAALLEAFANRLRKRARHLGRWARRRSISCYRIYDRDLPGAPLVIDRYDDAVHVAVFQRRRGPALEAPLLEALCDAICQVLDVPAASLWLKTRERQRGTSQYERMADAHDVRVVREGDCKLEVNLSDYLDTGLFLDHRPLRLHVGEQARGRNLLNLFCYTGAFTVHAAVGGAGRTVSVDLSNTYTAWLERNLALNGLPGDERHHVVADDVLGWVRGARSAPERFDLIVLDPPTFSNSKKRMRGTWDVQRDHTALLHDVAALLAPGGTLYFSTNKRGFRLELPAGLRGDEISRWTVPEDCKLQPPHRCWSLTRL
jgi:23S rRNA G2069 N7-methylase RlmK/C1962 C5-methylase RlmI